MVMLLSRVELFVKSMELEEIIKKWTGFETKGESEFDTIKEASLTFDGDTDEIKLSEKEIENLKTCLKLEKKFAESPCDNGAHFECVQENGDRFHFSIASDGDFICMDQYVYEVKSPGGEKISKFLREFRR